MGSNTAKIAGLAALGATGLGLAGAGPMAGLMGGAIGPITEAGALGAGAFDMGGVAGGVAGAGGPTGLPAAMGMNLPSAASGMNAMQALQMGGMAQNLMQPRPAGAGGPQMAGGMPTPMPGGAQQGQFAALAPYQLPGGMALHSMDTARRFRRGMYG